ncbi:hypothetical protein BWR60_36070, partial [Inquilinus limosus]
GGGGTLGGRVLSQAEREARQRALQVALREEEARRHMPEPAEAEPALEPEIVEVAPEPAAPLDPESLRRRELEELAAIENEAKRKIEEERFLLEEEQKRRDAERAAEDARRKAVADRSGQAAAARAPAADQAGLRGVPATADDEEDTRRRTGGGPGRGAPGRGALPGARSGRPARRPGHGR